MPILLRQAAFYGHDRSKVDFFSGSVSISSLVPHLFHCSLAGRPYIVDFSQPFYRQYRRQLTQITRTQADTSTDPGEQTLDPSGMWRRSAEDWSLGAGQRWKDRKESLPNRFWASKGMDMLTERWQMTLLPDTTLMRAATNTNLALVYAGAYVYLVDGTHVYFATTTTGPWTAVAGTPAVICSSICTDGNSVWMAYGASGVYVTTAGSVAAATQFITSPLDSGALLGYTNARLMLANLNSLYNLTASGALPSTPLWAAGNPATRFVAFAEGNDDIYVAGGVGNRHYIWGMAVTSDGTQLGAPIVQGQVPDGEVIASLYGYLGFLIVGTSEGVRMCTTGSTGSVSLGSLIPTPNPVAALTGWDRFVYFGWTGYDNLSTGIGRMDLQNHVIANVLPAYCSDLMAPGGAPVVSLVAWYDDICFAVAGVGVYAPDDTHLVASGDEYSGLIMYDLTDPKVACQIDVGGPITAGSYGMELSTDQGPFVPIGSHRSVDGEPVTFSCGPVTGQTFEIHTILYRDPVNPATGPAITRATLRAYPAPHRPLTWQLPIILNEAVVDITDGVNSFDPLAELEALEAMTETGQMVTFQEGPNAYPVFITDVSFLPTYPTRDKHFFNGIALLTLQGLPPPGG